MAGLLDVRSSRIPFLRPMLLVIGAIWAGLIANYTLWRSPADLTTSMNPSIYSAITTNFTADRHIGRAPIAKISMLLGDADFNPIMERALSSHLDHNLVFGYSQFVLREQMIPGNIYWSKPGWILDILLQELAKPETQRIQWLMWIDSDTVLMNPNIPLETFLPPTPDWNHIHCLVTHDHNGLNTGAFFLRVHEWSVYLMTRTLTYRKHNLGVKLKYSDQSVMEILFNEPGFAEHVMHVPQRWFNAYVGNRGSDPPDPRKPMVKVTKNGFLAGTLLCHFAGHHHGGVRQQRMQVWLDASDEHLPMFEAKVNDTYYPDEVRKFWESEAPREKETMDGERARLAELRRPKAVKQEPPKQRKRKVGG